MMRSIKAVDFEGPAGRLQGLLHRAAGAPGFLAVVSHPHPLFGGSMDNRVAYRTARGLEDAGALVLRYNFRGVGRSEGSHDRGLGEQDDLRAAMDFLRASIEDTLPLILAGFSFGSVVSAKVAASDAKVKGLLLVGAPVRTHAFHELLGFGRPVACVQGSRDEHGPIDALQAAWAAIPEPKRLVIVEGAGHFFEGEQPQLQASVTALAAFLLDPDDQSTATGRLHDPGNSASGQGSSG
jgi:alpha/beta superfamily hydrolase